MFIVTIVPKKLIILMSIATTVVPDLIKVT